MLSLAHHLSHLAVLLMVLAVATAALTGWGRIGARGLGLAAIELPLFTLLPWLGFSLLLPLAALLHFIFPMNLWMSLALGGIGLAGLWLPGVPIARDHHALERLLRIHWMAVTLAVVMLLAWCSRSMTVPDNHDTGLYHLTSIRWLNEYPLVPGLGNVQGRLAFNQSYFFFPALLNLAPYWWHGAGAGSVLLLALTAATTLEAGWRGWVARPWSFWLLLAVATYAGNLSAPTPDSPAALLQVVVFLLLLRLLATRERPDEAFDACQAGVLLLCVCMPTIKLSAAFFALASILVAAGCRLDRLASRRTLWLKAIAWCCLVALVHVARGYFLSGAPLYPVKLGALWSLDWTVSAEMFEGEARWIYEAARNPNYATEPIRHGWRWLGPWLHGFPRGTAALFGAALLCALADALLALRGSQRPSPVLRSPLYWLYLPLLGATVFWFFAAPDPRFLGLVPALLLFLAAMMLLRRLRLQFPATALSMPRSTPVRRGAFAACLLLVLLKLAGPRMMSVSGWHPLPVVTGPMRQTDSGLVVLVPTEDPYCWYAPLPCTPYFNPALRLRGDPQRGLAAGFSVQPTTRP